MKVLIDKAADRRRRIQMLEHLKLWGPPKLPCGGTVSNYQFLTLDLTDENVCLEASTVCLYEHAKEVD